jgi:hypothetical protein
MGVRRVWVRMESRKLGEEKNSVRKEKGSRFGDSWNPCVRHRDLLGCAGIGTHENLEE